MEFKTLQRQSIREFASNSAFERAHLGGRISSLGFDYIAIPAMHAWHLEGDETTDRIHKTLESFAFPPSHGILSSASLNPFINQLIAHPEYVVEVDKPYLEAAFDALRGTMKNRLLLNPSPEERSRYYEPGIISLYPLMSKSPVSKEGIQRVEKLLVDLIASPRYRCLYSGADIEQALKIIVNEYAVNYRTLFAYASRKRKIDEVYSALENAAGGQIKEMLHAIKEKL